MMKRNIITRLESAYIRDINVEFLNEEMCTKMGT